MKFKLNPNVIWGLSFVLIYAWATFGETHMLPNFKQIFIGFYELLTEKDLIYHLFKSMGLFFKGVIFATILSLIIVYSSPYKYFKPLSKFASQCRFLPMIGFTFYASLLFTSVRSVQTALLVFFISTFFITGLLAMIEDINDEEWQHARTLGLTKWECIKELIILGRIDYVIDILRQNIAISFMMIVSVEMILFGNGGLGTLLRSAEKWDNQGRIIALQLLILLIGIFLNYGLDRGRKVFFRYSF